MADLNQQLSAIRDEDTEKRLRVAELASAQESRDLNTDELAELEEIETRVGELADKQTGIHRLLKIGAYEKSVNDPIGLDKKEVREFSILKLINALGRNATQADRDKATLELEASRAVADQLKVEPKGVFLPMEMMGAWEGRELYEEKRKSFIRGEKRDLTADVFTQAGALVGVDFRPDQMISLLRNQMALTSLGVTYLDGLVGDLAIPKQTGAGTVGWIGNDGGAIGETSQTVSQVTLTPHTVGAYTDYSRQLRLQSSIGVEQFIRNDLTMGLALEEDRVAFHGSGTSGEPVGIENATGIGTESFSTGSTPTRGEVVAMRGDLATSNAHIGGLAYATESTVYGNMLNTVVDSGSGIFLLSDGGQLLGKPVVESNQITDGQLYFGNWNDLIVGSWGGLDLLVDPYTGATSGNVRVLVFKSCDVAVRHAASFTLGS